MVELRDATPADANAIANVLVRSWRAAYRGLLPDDVLAGLSVPDRERFWSGVLTALPPRTRTAVATIAGTVVGFAATGPPHVPADRAIRFYHRHGWTDTGRSQLDRGPGDTELHERRLHHDLS
jgi:hypothetical protein